MIARLGPNFTRVGDEFGDDELQVLEHLGREDLVEHLKRGACLRGCIVGGWELEAELHFSFGWATVSTHLGACDIPGGG